MITSKPVTVRATVSMPESFVASLYFVKGEQPWRCLFAEMRQFFSDKGRGLPAFFAFAIPLHKQEERQLRAVRKMYDDVNKVVFVYIHADDFQYLKLLCFRYKISLSSLTRLFVNSKILELEKLEEME